MGMESIQEQPAPFEQKVDVATEVFVLAAEKRMLEIKRINLESALKASPKSDKDKVKALKQEIKKSRTEIKKLDTFLKKNGNKKVGGFMKAAKESAKAREEEDEKGKEEVK